MLKFLATFVYSNLPSYSLAIVAKDADAALKIASAHVSIIPCQSIEIKAV
jgi:hypothetical protein